MKLCSIEGCKNRHNAHGWCTTHYQRNRRHGSPHVVNRALKGTGYLDRVTGYRILFIDGKRKLEHRHVMESMLGRPLREDENVHHINGIRDDNRPRNLELWSTSQPSGQRVEDKIAWMTEFLSRYGYSTACNI